MTSACVSLFYVATAVQQGPGGAPWGFPVFTPRLNSDSDAGYAAVLPLTLLRAPVSGIGLGLKRAWVTPWSRPKKFLSPSSPQFASRGVLLVQAHVHDLHAPFRAFVHECVLGHQVRHIIRALLIRALAMADGGALLDGRPACASALHRVTVEFACQWTAVVRTPRQIIDPPHSWSIGWPPIKQRTVWSCLGDSAQTPAASSAASSRPNSKSARLRVSSLPNRSPACRSEYSPYPVSDASAY